MIDNLFKLSRQFLRNYNRPYKRYFLHQYPLENRFSIIIGPRGTGKTTAIIQHLLSKYDDDFFTREALYVPVDHFIIAGHNLYGIAEEFHNLGGECICFDEIHKWGNWSGEIKSIYDSFPKLRIIASGSSAIAIQRGSHDLSRRAVVYRMTGLSFREYIDLVLDISSKPLSLEFILEQHEKSTANIIESVESAGAKILALFKEYLRFGYFPYFQEFKDESIYHITLEQSIHTTIESDLLAVYPELSGRSIQKLKKLLTVISESVPFVPDLKRLKKLVEIGDERTLKNYLKYLEDGGTIILLPKRGTGLKGMAKPEKIYLNNPNQIYAISNKGKENIGNIRETFFAGMLGGIHRISVPKRGDFFVEGSYTFEIGGRNKGFEQIRDIPDSYLAIDDIEMGIGNKIPLWLFGFLY
jgi:predicted AAA+ superfamily ATPase